MNEHTEREPRLDALLDAALARYGEAEPLAGLEERVLRRLQADRPRRASWMWSVAIAAVAALVIALVMTRPAAQQEPVPVVAQQPKQPPALLTPPQLAPVQAAHGPAHALPRQAPPQSARTEKLPRLDVFPTPEPPSEQERLLVRYIRSTPRAEVLAQVNRQPLEFHEDPLSAPVTNTSPAKSEGTR